MKTSRRVIILLIILLIIIILINRALAAVVEPLNISYDEALKIAKNDTTQETKISFWDLPLWIKLHHIFLLIVGALSAWKFLPIVITKIKSALENAKRRKILKIIMRNPGISLKELEELTKMNRSTLKFHLNFLESEGWISSTKIGKHRLFFLNNSSSKDPMIVKSERKKQIIELLNQNGELTIKEIANKLGS